MGNVFYYIKSDYKAALFLAINNLRRLFFLNTSSLYMRWKLKTMGVKLGRNIKWGGNAQVERFPMSKIIIGNRCVFNSKSIFNQRGIKKCIIQTGKIGAAIKIGDDCSFSGISIVADSEVLIGNNVMVGADSLIGDRDGHADRLHTHTAKIIIEDNVFIGMHCMVLKGVTIGKNSIIGAGSIVTKDIPSNVVAVGVPCKVIRKIDDSVDCNKI